MKGKNKREPGIFFTDPSGANVSDGTKDTVEIFVKGGHIPYTANHLSEDYKRFINIKYDSEKKVWKREI